MEIRDRNGLSREAMNVIFDYEDATICLASVGELGELTVYNHAGNDVTADVLVAARRAVAEDHGVVAFECSAVSIRDAMAGIDWLIAHDEK